MLPCPAARYKQRTVLKIQGASHTTESPQRVHRGWRWSVKLHSLKRKRSKRAAGPRHGLVDVAGAPLLAVEADLLRRVLLLRTARRSADVGHRLGWRHVRCRRGGRGRGSRRGGSLRIALGLALARDNLPPAERAARHRVVVVGKGARGEGLVAVELVLIELLRHRVCEEVCMQVSASAPSDRLTLRRKMSWSVERV